MDKWKGLSSTSVFKRTMFVMLMFGVAAFAVLIGKLFQVQVIAYQDYQEQAVAQQTRDEIITPNRGKIYDANLNELAVSATVETVCISPNDIVDDEDHTKEEWADIIASGLSQILDVDYDKIYQKAMKTGSYYEYVAKKIESDLADQVRQFITDKELGNRVFLVEDTKRYYPYGTIASQVLGFVGTDNNGLYGVEYYYDSTLQGTPGRIVAAKNAKGTDMPYEYEQYCDAEDGDSLVLTIDVVIQNYLEQALEEARENAKARIGATGIVMDVRTGEILAMASTPSYDPNDPTTIQDGQTNESLSLLTGDEYNAALAEARGLMWSNKAISYTYEPGSVFKIITGAMALEEGVTSLDDNSFYCAGPKSITIYDRKIGCWYSPGHGQETFSDGVKNSCNPVFIELGNRLGGSTFFKYFEAFGLTQKTGIDLAGEGGGSAALYHSESYLTTVPIALATSTFGQTFNVTPLQLITAISAVVNGGTLYQTHVVKEILDADGNAKETIDPIVVRQVVTEKTSQDMCTALARVVSEGTGSNAYVKGYSVGGKTGTTVKTQTYMDDQKLYISSFLGFAPSNDPRIAVLILIDEPTTYTHSGNMLSAPYVADILEKSLKYLGVEPSYTDDEYATLDVVTPDFTGMTGAEVAKVMEEYDLSYTIKGDGDVVTDQMPDSGVSVPRSAEIVVYMGGSKPSYPITIPNVVGMTLGGIQRLLKDSDIYVRAVGNTTKDSLVLSVSQDPEYGTVVEPGTVLTVSFVEDTSDEDIQ